MLKDKVLQMLQDSRMKYFSAKQIYQLFDAYSAAERKTLDKVIAQLQEECIVFDEVRRKFRFAKEGELGRAQFDANAKGFGFLLVEGGDLFVPASRRNGACHKDMVVYKRLESTADEAEVIKVLSRGITSVVGEFEKHRYGGVVFPDDSRLAQVRILQSNTATALDGQKVVATIVKYPTSGGLLEGKIVQVLGYPDGKNVDMLSVAAAFGLSNQFEPKVLQQAQKADVGIDEKSLAGRQDLRHLSVFTIDGEDAKDLDDAVSIAKTEGGFQLSVHIADISHYVKAGDSVDKEAFARGTSVYFPQMVFPMLPTQLSNGICSLFAGVDRLTLTCRMQIDNKGKIVSYNIFPSVIRSKYRLTYTEVQAIFDGDKSLQKRYSDIVSDLFAMKTLAEILQNKRLKRGVVEFKSSETAFVFDKKGEVVDILPYQTTFAHSLIEEFMIAANECTAQFAQNFQLPFVYRVHEKPDEEKYHNLLELIKGVGIAVKKSRGIHSSVLQDALHKAESTPYFNLINDVMLRSMQKAKYSTQNTGHFGLDSLCYCHFTSPIRRYPDLVVHRILKAALAGQITQNTLVQFGEMAQDCARQANEREKNADEAERKAVDVKKCTFAEKLVGQCFDAVVSGVTERGIFCQLSNTLEGFVSADKLGGRLLFDKERFCLHNDAVSFRLGDSVRILVSAAHKQSAKIDFDLAQDVDITTK